MTIALWCVLVAAFLPLLFTALAKSGKGFDNAKPRDYLEHTTDWRRRSYWAHLNGFEAYPPFAAAVIIAHVIAGANETANLLAIAFIGLRLAYGACYIANLALLRSLIWFGATLCTVGLFVVAARAS